MQWLQQINVEQIKYYNINHKLKKIHCKQPDIAVN